MVLVGNEKNINKVETITIILVKCLARPNSTNKKNCLLFHVNLKWCLKYLEALGEDDNRRRKKTKETIFNFLC